jgi:HD superfamily phosphohydrolase
VDLSELQSALEKFAEEKLARYTKGLSSDLIARSPKEFSDPVWKTIYLTAFEVVILDSPLSQRLRLIKQLGVVHWVYPGAAHARFEHSLGAVFQIQELVESINRSVRGKPELLISAGEQSLLRLTALCHDLGHGVMSHVSENALKSFREAEDLRLAFVDEHPPLERVQLSEMVAFYLVGSPAFKALVEKAKAVTGETDLPENACGLAQKAIIGETISNKVPLLQELISGPFDADKLDYMQRDALMAGVPAVTDVPRLVRKLRAVALPLTELPEELQERVNTGEPYYVVFGLAFSGTRTLDELLLGRILLFDKVYRHQKVRAIEGMVSLLLFNLAKLYKHPTVFLPYHLSDEQLIFADRAIADDNAFDISGEERQTWALVVGELSESLRDRRLFVRAFAFAKNMPGDPYRYDPTQRVGAGNLLSDLEWEKKVGFAESIASEVLVVLGKLNRTEAITTIFADKTLASYIYIDPPQPPAHAGKIPHAYLLAEDRRIGRFRDTSTEMRSWADAYLFAKDIGYVFCPPELKPYVFLAVEKILRDRYGLRSFPAMFDYVKQHSNIDQTKRELNAAGYYSASPHDLRPKAARLLKGDIPAKFRTVRASLQGYSGPYVDQSSDSLTTDYLAEKHLEDWLQQFETEQLIGCACAVLANIRLIGRRQIVAAIKSFKDENQDFANAVLAPLGDIRDSGPSIAYFSGDVAGVSVMGIEQALQEQRPIILVDDFIGSGRQAVTIVETLLGEKLTYELGEGIRLKLDENERTLFRKSRLVFIYAAGWEEGRTELTRALNQYGLQAEVHLGMSDAALPNIHDVSLFPSPADQTAFIEKCQDIGRNLLIEPEDLKHDEKWADERALGYGNKGLLIVFPYNTPSQTLTCLWKSGDYKGLPWQALLPRRKKK